MTGGGDGRPVRPPVPAFPSPLVPMRLPGLILCLAVASGCASGGSPGASGPPPRNSDLITEQELATAPYGNAYDAIQHLRPQMLIHRAGPGSSSITQQASYAIKVYMDGVPIGGIADLRQLPPARARIPRAQPVLRRRVRAGFLAGFAIWMGSTTGSESGAGPHAWAATGSRGCL